VVRQQGQTDRHGVDPGLAESGDEDQVSLGLAHLRPAEADHGLVDIGARERRGAGDGARLDGAHLVVGKDQVGAAALHVERHTEIVQSDRRALDVPPGPAVAEVPAGPERLARTCGPPQQRVQLIALARTLRVSPALGEDRHHLVAVP